MAKLLLSSSQVQVVASCLVIVFCTFALFISGYIIQQRTLSELRYAIRPREGKPSPRVALPEQRAYLPEKFRPKKQHKEDTKVEDFITEDHPVVEVKETKPEAPAKEETESGKEPADKKPPSPENVKIVEELQAMLNEKVMMKTQKEEAAEKRKPKVKPISRAQRRRMIKQDLRKIAGNENPAYYQRRLW